MREDFWNRYLERYPGLFKPTKSSNVWLPIFPDQSVILSMYVGSNESGMFLRGPLGTDGTELAALMEGNQEKLDEALGPSQARTEGHYYVSWHDIALQ